MICTEIDVYYTKYIQNALNKNVYIVVESGKIDKLMSIKSGRYRKSAPIMKENIEFARL